MAAQDNPEKPKSLEYKSLRPVYLTVGYASLGLAAAGVVLPLLPTTPFLLVAAWSFAKSSPRLRERLYANPRFGPLLRDWHERRAIPRRAKAVALGSLGASWGVLWVVAMPQPLVPLVAAVPMGAVAIFIATRPGGLPPAPPAL